MGGVQGGFDYQFAPNWVVGAEAQYSWLSNNNNGVLFPGSTLVTTNSNQLGSATGRLGYARHLPGWHDPNLLARRLRYLVPPRLAAISP